MHTSRPLGSLGPRTKLFALALLAFAPLPAPAAEDSDSAGSRIELSYPTQYREAAGIFETVSKQPLVDELKIRKADLLNVYDATDKPLQHRQSAAADVAGSHAPKALQGNSGSMMLWGPYVNLEEGHYLVVYRFQLAPDPAPRGTLFLDVCHQACTRSGLRLDAAKQPAGQWQEIAVPVYLPEAKKLEFRFWPDRNVTAIDRVYLFKVVPGPRAEKKDAPEELPAGEPVDDRNDVVRSPHTDDDGMIDISGLPKDAKVRCPYTGKYFRVP